MHSQPHVFDPPTCRKLDTKCADDEYIADRYLHVDRYGKERDAHPQHYRHSGCDQCATARLFIDSFAT